jgi:hypothetical protein
MGLFDELLNAVNNPNQQANPDQLGSIINTVQQLSGNHGTDPGTTQTILSVVGDYVRSSLQSTDPNQAQGLVNQYAGNSGNPEAVDALLGGAMQQQLVQDLIQRTGLDPQTIESMLPTLVPLVLNVLQGGNSQGGGNPLLNAFLDSNRDGSLDLGDAFKLAGQFFGQR